MRDTSRKVELGSTLYDTFYVSDQRNVLNYKVLSNIMASERVISGFGLEETAGEESHFEDNHNNRDESGSESGRDSDDDDENRKFNEMLIEAVRAKPLLYDKSLRDYKDGEKINLAWRKIGEELIF